MSTNNNLRHIAVTRYITPLREGGSLPALAEGDDDFTYVLKFRGAGHGVKGLIAELIGGEIARSLGLKTPELVFADLDEAFGRTEADEEIQDLLKASQGTNLALHYLSGAINYDAVANDVQEELASKIVWLDSFITNVDRTFRNTNMLIWHKELWLIDHGASLYFHHAWANWEKNAKTEFTLIRDHVLLPKASKLDQASSDALAIITSQKIKNIVSLIPEEWLEWQDTDQNSGQIRQTYIDFLTLRLQHSSTFTLAAQNARKALI